MNERIRELIEKATIRGEVYLPGNDGHPTPTVYFDKEKFAELIVRMCADYADMAQDAGCAYAGDYVAEAMGYGEEEGITAWRNNVA